MIKDVFVFAKTSQKLSEKPRTHLQRSPAGRQRGAFRFISPSVYQPNPRLERRSYPFSDSFSTSVGWIEGRGPGLLYAPAPLSLRASGVAAILRGRAAVLRRSSPGLSRRMHPENRDRGTPSRSRVRSGLSCRPAPGRSPQTEPTIAQRMAAARLGRIMSRRMSRLHSSPKTSSGRLTGHPEWWASVIEPSRQPVGLQGQYAMLFGPVTRCNKCA